MATNLLLEGDDLEGLLSRARQEGGPRARIVRAEKVRRGGMLGFFAREGFEVAVEIPDGLPEEEDVFTAVSRALADELAAEHTAGRSPGLPPLLPAPAPAPEQSEDPFGLFSPASVGARADGVRAVAERVEAARMAAAEHVAAQDAAARQQPATAGALARVAAHRFGVPAGNPATTLLDRLGSQEEAGLSAEAPAEPVPAPPTEPQEQSATSFSALLQELRAGTRPARLHVLAPVPSDQEQPVAEFVPAVLASVPAATAAPSEPLAIDVRPPVEKPAPAIEPAAPQRPQRAARVARRTDPALAADRRALRAAGLPAAWARRLRSGDTFSAVLAVLARMPEAQIDPDAEVVVVTGHPQTVLLEAHRIAVDLADGRRPRPVVVVPETDGPQREAALRLARRPGRVVVAVEAARPDGPAAARAREVLGEVRPGVVVCALEASDGLAAHKQWVQDLGRVDAVTVEGATGGPAPAASLQLGVPVVRLDGVPLDRYTWTALLCAQLLAGREQRHR